MRIDFVPHLLHNRRYVGEYRYWAIVKKYLLTTKPFFGKCEAFMIRENGTSNTGIIHRYYKYKCATAKKLEDGIDGTLTYCVFLREYWTRIRTNNVIERLNREIRRRTRVVGSFPDGNSALMLVCARLRHVAGPSGETRST